MHVHLSGNGKGGMDCWHRRRWIMRPFLRAGARDIGLECGFGDLRFDELYLKKLLQWVSESTLEAAVLLACDWVRDDQGAVRKDLSDLFVSNDEVFAAVKQSPKLLAGISVHPARPDALDELDRCAAAGAVLLKLLPCVQNVDLRAIRNPLEKKIELTRALGFPERVFTDLWNLIPAGCRPLHAGL